MTKQRFSKQATLDVLDDLSRKLAAQHKFNRNNGTSQLNPKDRMYDEDIDRAIAYGRMRAFEDFACMVEEGFRFQQKESL